MRPVTRHRAWMPVALALALGACASGGSPPPPNGLNLAPAVDRLSMDVSGLRLAPLKAHRFDPSDGLDPTEVAVLAVLNSPDLAAKRASAKIAEAQAFSAGLLPDPQLALSADFPLPSSGAKTAYNINPSLDLMALVTHSTALKAARASARKADLDLLWAEWSTAQQARQLVVSILGGEAKIKVLEIIVQSLDDRAARSRLALARHDVTLATTSADQAAQLDAHAQLDTARHDAAKARGDLNAVIGLAPTVRLDLVAGGPPIAPSSDSLDRALAALPDRRPDLLALRAGYDAQNANVRKALLARFPLINLGFSHQGDNGGIISNGLAATLVIPIFNGGRGEIAVQTATRAQLSVELQARIDQTVADVAAARRDRDTAWQTLARLEDQVPAFIAAAEQARAAAGHGDIDSAAFLALDQAALKERLAILDQRLAVALADISLETVLFLPSDESVAR